MAESCFNPKGRLGAQINVEAPVSGAETSKRAAGKAATTLFNESQSRIVISIAPKNLDKTISILEEAGAPFQRLGQVSGDQLRIQVGKEKFAWPIAELYDGWWNSIRRLVESDSGAEGIPSL
jgi:phosphoribosylformylglycinamidine synthase